MDEVQRFTLRVDLIQPIQRIHLHTVNPNLPMQVWSRDAARRPDLTDQFSSLNLLTERASCCAVYLNASYR